LVAYQEIAIVEQTLALEPQEVVFTVPSMRTLALLHCDAMKTLLNFVGALAAIWVVVSLAAYLLQDRMLFLPQAVSSQTRKRLKEFETRFDHDGTALHGWLYRKQGAEDLPFVIYYGGNGEEVSWNFSHFAELSLSGFLLMSGLGRRRRTSDSAHGGWPAPRDTVRSTQ
jgi:hypothetical protein